MNHERQPLNLRGGESHIEVPKFFFPRRCGRIAVLSLVLQRMLPVYFPRLESWIFRFSPSRHYLISPEAGAILPRIALAPSWDHARRLTANSPARRIWNGPRPWMGSCILDWFSLGYEHPSSRVLPSWRLLFSHQAILTVVRRLLLNEPKAGFHMPSPIVTLVNAIPSLVLSHFSTPPSRVLKAS